MVFVLIILRGPCLPHELIGAAQEPYLAWPWQVSLTTAVGSRVSVDGLGRSDFLFLQDANVNLVACCWLYRCMANGSGDLIRVG